jgi:hypothetical protein
MVSCRLVSGAVQLAEPAQQSVFPLRGKKTMIVMYSAWSAENGRVLFDLLFEGKPHYLVTALAFPLSLTDKDFYCNLPTADTEDSEEDQCD